MEAALGGRELLLLLPLAAALLGPAAPLQLGQVPPAPGSAPGSGSGPGSGPGRGGASPSPCPSLSLPSLPPRGVSRTLPGRWASPGRLGRAGGIGGGSRWRGWRKRAESVALDGGGTGTGFPGCSAWQPKVYYPCLQRLTCCPRAFRSKMYTYGTKGVCHKLGYRGGNASLLPLMIRFCRIWYAEISIWQVGGAK